MLKKLTAAGVVAAAVSGALVLASLTNADINTSGDGSILGGNQLVVPISIPVNVCGNAVAVVGGARAGCRGGASAGYGLHHHRRFTPWDS